MPAFKISTSERVNPVAVCYGEKGYAVVLHLMSKQAMYRFHCSRDVVGISQYSQVKGLIQWQCVIVKRVKPLCYTSYQN